MPISGRRLRPSLTGEGGGTNYGVVARLKDGVTWPQAAAEVGAAVDSTIDAAHLGRRASRCRTR